MNRWGGREAPIISDYPLTAEHCVSSSSKGIQVNTIFSTFFTNIVAIDGKEAVHTIMVVELAHVFCVAVWLMILVVCGLGLFSSLE